MSTKNHNILYFVNISRTCPLNIAVRLWKVANSLAECVFSRHEPAENPIKTGRSSHLSAHFKPIPGFSPAQGAEAVQFQ